jgi:predicted small metal-binding protein
MKEVRCADAGMACDFVARAETEQDLLQKVAQHAREKHGITEVTPELVAKVKQIMHEVK